MVNMLARNCLRFVVQKDSVWGVKALALMLLFAIAIAPDALAQAAKGKPIKIGVLASLTGNLAPLGTDALPGAEIFAEEINAKGGINGRPIELVIYDDESKASVLVTRAKRLIQKDEVVAILGPVSSAISLSLTPVVNDAKIPIINCGCRTGPITRFEFTTFPMQGIMASLAQFAKDRDIKEIAVVSVAGSLAEQIKRYSVPEIEAAGVAVVAFEQFQPTDTDVTPILAGLRSKGFKVIFAAASGATAAIAAKNFHQLRYPGYYWTFQGNANESFINLVGDAADIVNLSSTKILVYDELPDSDPMKPRLTEFAEKYRAKTGKSAGLTASFYYDGMASFAEAIRQGGDDPERIRDALENQRGLQLLNGVVNRSSGQHNGIDPEWVVLYIDKAKKRFTLKKP